MGIVPVEMLEELNVFQNLVFARGALSRVANQAFRIFVSITTEGSPASMLPFL